MKKNISINIGGIIFHIEEDGYNKLKSYLDSVSKYFSSFEDSKEIIADIEGRIAEIFLSKLDAGKQSINEEDVEHLVATMGTTEDFEATIESGAEKEEQENTEKDKRTKKFFRSSEDRVLGGVAGGISSYFGIDSVIIRLLFVLSIFLGGAGILIYLILWIVASEANSITEKMKMQGEPFTITNIEDNLKKGLNMKDGEENIFIKILTFPFKLIAIVFKALGEILSPILIFCGKALRMGVGIFLILLGSVLMIVSTITLAVGIGIGGSMDHWVHFGDFPTQELFNSMGTIVIISAYIVFMIPFLAILILGLLIALKKKVINAFVAWGLFGLWLLSLIGLAIAVPTLIRNYSAEAIYKEERSFALTDGIIDLKLNELYIDSYDRVTLRIRGHKDSTLYLLKMDVDARGYSRTNAKENGEAVKYAVVQKDNEFYFDSEINLGDTPFRFQEVSATFYIPYGKTFRMDYDLLKILKNTLWIHDYSSSDLGDNEWVFDKHGLKCLTCDPSD